MFPGYFDDDQLYRHASDLEERMNLSGEASASEALEVLKRSLDTILCGLGHRFGEFGPPAAAGRIRTERGQQVPIFRCTPCEHLAAPVSIISSRCPVCGSDQLVRDDEVLYRSEERFSQEIDLRQPRIVLDPASLKEIARISVNRQPDGADVCFLDLYGVMQERRENQERCRVHAVQLGQAFL